MTWRKSSIRSVASVAVLALAAAACAGGASAEEGALEMSIHEPVGGAHVSVPFTLTVDASVPLGDPGSGEHHVHLCFDGGDCDTEYTLVYGETFTVSDLPPGEHTIEASLRNADHSDAGVGDRVTVTVTGGTVSFGEQDDLRY